MDIYIYFIKILKDIWWMFECSLQKADGLHWDTSDAIWGVIILLNVSTFVLK